MEESLIATRSSRGAKRGSLRLPLLCGAILAALTVDAGAQTAPLPRGAEQAPPDLRPFIGAWEIAEIDAPRKCTVTFGAEVAASGRQLRFPATCRRALPLLGQAASWSVTPTGQPRLNDAAGKALIEFRRPAPDAGLEGAGPDGKRYALDSKDHPRAARPRAVSTAERAATAAARPTTVNAAAAPDAATVPGHYVMMRQANREACRIMLQTGNAGAASAPAAFEGACQDTGLTIFDPVGWRYAGGRLSLVARKGHSVDLVFENGQWRKDPAVGAPLLLKKLP